MPLSMSRRDLNLKLCVFSRVLSCSWNKIVEEHKRLAKHHALLPTDNIHLIIYSHYTKKTDCKFKAHVSLCQMVLFVSKRNVEADVLNVLRIHQRTYPWWLLWKKKCLFVLCAPKVCGFQLTICIMVLRQLLRTRKHKDK